MMNHRCGAWLGVAGRPPPAPKVSACEQAARGAAELFTSAALPGPVQMAHGSGHEQLRSAMRSHTRQNVCVTVLYMLAAMVCAPLAVMSGWS